METNITPTVLWPNTMPTEIGRNAMHTVKGRNTMPILLIQFLLNEQQYNFNIFGKWSAYHNEKKYKVNFNWRKTISTALDEIQPL